jgi:hypothetical protein
LANTSLDLINLDFELQKNSLKTFLAAQPQFRDYDYTGSNINVLLDLLVYNTLKNAFFLNMNVAESFLDSAQLRASVLSHAKDLNYTPRSARSARANITMSFQASQESQPYIIPKGASFSTLIKAESFIFSIPETIILSSANTTYEFTTDIYEGIYLKDTYVFASLEENQRFRISNRNVDTESLNVQIYEDGSIVGTKYLLATSLLDLDSASKVYFLQASENGYYEIIFGNGVIGRKPKQGSTIIIDYRVSAAEKANGSRNFVANFDPTGLISELLDAPLTITTNEVASGGVGPETLESIKYLAPRHFQVQERAVIESDTEVLLREQFPEINAVAVFGGEKLDPPRFGKIFVSVDISNVDGLPDSKKTEYTNFLRRRCNLSIKPIFVEPEFTYIDIHSLVRYNINTSNLTAENIKTLVVFTIDEYNDLNLNNFNVTLRYSQLIDLISSIDESIVSNITTVQIYKKIEPLLATLQNMDIDFATALDDKYSILDTRYPVTDETTITSDNFTVNGQTVSLADDGNGNIRLVKNNGAFNTIVTNVGSVDYASGKISLVNFLVDNFVGNHIKIYAKPKDLDIAAAQNTILGIEPDSITVDVEFLRL